MRDFLHHERSAAQLEAVQYLFESPHIPCSARLRHYAARHFRLAGHSSLRCSISPDVSATDFIYDPQATSVSTPLHDVLRAGRGVCQDFAHVQIGCLRALGLAARYVSGYLVTRPPPGQPRLVGADASHAWVVGVLSGVWLD